MPPLLPMFPPTRGRTATTTDTYTAPTKIQAGFGTLIQAGIVSFVSVFTPSKMEYCAKRFDIRIEPTLAGRDEVPVGRRRVFATSRCCQKRISYHQICNNSSRKIERRKS